MQFTLLITALMGTLATSLPTPSNDLTIRQDTYEPKSPNLGAYLYKSPNLTGSRVPEDKTPITGTSYCVNLDQLYGSWDRATRSLVVYPGFKCYFYTEQGCEQGRKFWLGKKADYGVKKTLIKDFDGKIRSVVCRPL
ncbi:hypothetical protein BU24DRAFT_466976 [Aaosphaeria arxii CBS 175.79]|uniref:Uncharacterized protein n=1 Tax=Aaosphaeria arxii CBS 175.79 TaxID=1450172 RepID=A0A6A5XBQ0_9PLEO|nr:uncharacterized protein BU24DRAFT_466976 [Aaosphaeria arxii CBS 175.79]KAF2010323.1 hypothetical protein BU24DRAFT_466976 [Aaosphaeria arxii CBS 175.79]